MDTAAYRGQLRATEAATSPYTTTCLLPNPEVEQLMLAIFPASFRLLPQGLSCALFCFLFTSIRSKGTSGLIKSSLASESKIHYSFVLCPCALEFLKEPQCHVDSTKALNWLLSSEVSYTFLLITAP